MLTDTPAHRIVFVTNGLARGGAETQLLHLAGGFVARGDEVGIVSILPEIEFDEVERMDLPVACVGVFPVARGAVAVASATRVLRTWAPDTLVSFVYQANVLARCAGRLAGVPTIVSSIRNEYFGGRAREMVLRVTDPLATVTTTNSARAAASLVARRIVPSERLAVVPNGLDLDRFRGDPARRRAIRSELGLIDDEFLWLAAGRLQEQKDYPTLLRAVAQLDEPRPLVAIAGVGPELSALVDLVRELGIAHCVRFLGLRDDVPDLLAAADGLVLSSAWEGSPNIVLEAMAAAVPVVATDVGGVAELVDSGRTGFVVAARRPAAIADALRAVMAMPPARRVAMGAAGRAVVTRRHSVAAMRAGWISVLEQGDAFARRHARASTRGPLVTRRNPS